MKIEQTYHIYAHKARAADEKLQKLLKTYGTLTSRLIQLEEQMQEQRQAHNEFSTLAINTLYLERGYGNRKNILKNKDFKPKNT
jgi:hypothetical protein